MANVKRKNQKSAASSLIQPLRQSLLTYCSHCSHILEELLWSVGQLAWCPNPSAGGRDTGLCFRTPCPPSGSRDRPFSQECFCCTERYVVKMRIMLALA